MEKKQWFMAKKVAEDNGVKVAYIFWSGNAWSIFKEPMSEVIGGSVDLLLRNEEEAMLFTGKDNLFGSREELKKVAKHL